MKRTFTLFVVLLGAAAQAQVNLPALPQGVPLPLPLPDPGLRDAVPALGAALPATVSSVRSRARALLARHPGGVERDPRGAPIVRSVIVGLAPDAEAIEQAISRGFELLSDATLDPWGERLVTLLAPRGLSTARALAQLRAADPGGSYDFDHLFVESATPVASPAGDSARIARDVVPEAGAAMAIGMIDGGVDPAHPAFAGRAPELLGCDGRVIPAPHGTAVASLLVGDAAPVFRGAAPGAALTAVDVYCGDDEPGGRVRDIAAGLALLAQRQVRVVNLSFVGPHNVVLERMVMRVLAQGMLVVAAAGNDGPNAKPLYPAAYPGVVAVTAVDARNRPLLEACRGRHVAFAAPGADMMAAAPGGGYTAVRGTSYAAPLVAGLLARELAVAGGDTVAARKRLEALAQQAGRRGRDDRFGRGILAQELRVAPTGLAARPASPPR